MIRRTKNKEQLYCNILRYKCMCIKIMRNNKKNVFSTAALRYRSPKCHRNAKFDSTSHFFFLCFILITQGNKKKTVESNLALRWHTTASMLLEILFYDMTKPSHGNAFHIIDLCKDSLCYRWFPSQRVSNAKLFWLFFTVAAVVVVVVVVVPFDNKSSLLQIMAWWRTQVTSYYLDQWWLKFTVVYLRLPVPKG